MTPARDPKQGFYRIYIRQSCLFVCVPLCSCFAQLAFCSSTTCQVPHIRHRALVVRSGVLECPCVVPWWGLLSVFKGPPPCVGLAWACLRLPGRSQASCFRCVFWPRLVTNFFVDFGSNLGPTWPPTWPQNRSKIKPRAIPNPSQLASCFRSPFGSDFTRFLIDF